MATVGQLFLISDLPLMAGKRLSIATDPPTVASRPDADSDDSPHSDPRDRAVLNGYEARVPAGVTGSHQSGRIAAQLPASAACMAVRSMLLLTGPCMPPADHHHALAMSALTSRASDKAAASQHSA